MPDDPQESKLRLIVNAVLMPIRNKKYDERTIDAAYISIMQSAFDAKLKFSNPRAVFERLFNALLDEIGKGGDCPEANHLIQLLYAEDWAQFTSEQKKAEAPLAGLMIESGLQRIVKVYSKRLIDELTGGTGRVSSLRLTDAIAKKFMEELLEKCKEEGLSVTKENLREALKAAFPGMDVSPFMTHCKEPEGPAGLGFHVTPPVKEPAKKEAKPAPKRAEKTPGEMHIDEMEAAEFRKLLSDSKQPVSLGSFGAAPKVRSVEEAWGEIKSAWEGKPSEFKERLVNIMVNWREGAQIPGSEPKVLLGLSNAERKETDLAYERLAKFKDTVTSCETLAKDEFQHTNSMLSSIVELKNATKDPKALEKFSGDQKALAQEGIKAQAVLRAMGALKFDLAVQIAVIELRKASELDATRFKQEFNSVLGYLREISAAKDPDTDHEVRLHNSNALNEFIYSLYEAAQRKPLSGTENERLAHAKAKSAASVDSFEAVFESVGKRVSETVGSPGWQINAKTSLENLLKFTDAMPEGLAKKKEDYILGFDKFLYSQSQKCGRQIEKENESGREKGAAAWRKYSEMLNAVRRDIGEDVKKFPARSQPVEKLFPKTKKTGRK